MMTVKDWNADVMNVPMTIFVVKVYAKWCGVCKTYGPVFDKVAKEYENQFVFARLDSEKFSDLCDTLNIMNLPTTMIVLDGQVIKKREGSMTEKQLKTWLLEEA